MPNVRGYTRGSGPVRQHTRKGRPRKPLISPRHSLKMLRKALGALRKKKRVTALAFGVLGVTEFTAWTALEGVSLILTTAGVLAVSAGLWGAAAGGVRR